MDKIRTFFRPSLSLGLAAGMFAMGLLPAKASDAVSIIGAVGDTLGAVGALAGAVPPPPGPDPYDDPAYVRLHGRRDANHHGQRKAGGMHAVHSTGFHSSGGHASGGHHK